MSKYAEHFDRDEYMPAEGEFRRYRKVATTQAVRIEGPFKVTTREGTLTCQDGYLAIDAHGWPYPIAREEFEAIYVPADEEAA